LLASSKKHFDRVVDRLKPLSSVDFNQGLDAGLLRPRHVSRLAELRGVKIRFSFDDVGKETKLHDAVRLCLSNGLKNISVYCLIGFDDTPEDARYRLEKILEWGAMPNPMRYRKRSRGRPVRFQGPL
jgi:hypothetical protein